jgi:chemotaxis-related protein WspD
MNAPGESKDALSLFDRELPSDYRREWTQRVAAEKKDIERGTSSVVVFRVALEWLALPASIFQEVAEHCILHPIPHRRGGTVAGLVTIRGELMLCASLADFLGIEKDLQHTNERIGKRLLVANRKGSRMAFPVDEVHGVVRYRPRDLKPVPATLAQAASTYTIGLLPWQDRSVGCLDDELLFYSLDESFS